MQPETNVNSGPVVNSSPVSATPAKSNKTLIIIIIAVVGLLACVMISCIALVWFSNSQDSITDYTTTDITSDDSDAKDDLQSQVDALNQLAPMMIDDETRFDSILLIDNKTVKYHYTLVQRRGEDLDLELLKSTLRESLITEIKTNDLIAPLREDNVTFVYSVQDMNEVFLFEITVTPTDYSGM